MLSYNEAELLDETRWLWFVQAAADTNVASTLTLPIVVDGSVTGTVNHYASTPDGFDGHHEELARLFDAWAPGAVTNADLGFATKQAAQQAPRQLREDIEIQLAAGLWATYKELDQETAMQSLADTAARAGVRLAQLASAIVSVSRSQSSD